MCLFVLILFFLVFCCFVLFFWFFFVFFVCFFCFPFALFNLLLLQTLSHSIHEHRETLVLRNVMRSQSLNVCVSLCPFLLLHCIRLLLLFTILFVLFYTVVAFFFFFFLFFFFLFSFFLFFFFLLQLTQPLQTKCQLNKFKSQHLVIGKERRCGVCGKFMGESALCVYPNGSVVHFRCAKEKHVDPVSQRNFEKEPVA